MMEGKTTAACALSLKHYIKEIKLLGLTISQESDRKPPDPQDLYLVNCLCIVFGLRMRKQILLFTSFLEQWDQQLGRHMIHVR